MERVGTWWRRAAARLDGISGLPLGAGAQLDQRAAGHAFVDQPDLVDLAQAAHAVYGGLGAVEHLARHFAQAFWQFRIFGDQLRITNREREMVGQVVLGARLRSPPTMRKPA